MYNDNEKLVDQNRLCIKYNEIQHHYHRNCGLYIYIYMNKNDFFLLFFVTFTDPFYILYDKDLYHICYKIGATMNKLSQVHIQNFCLKVLLTFQHQKCIK